MSLIVCKEVLAYTRGLTTKLQGTSVEAFEAYNYVNVVKETVENVRSKINEYHTPNLPA